MDTDPGETGRDTDADTDSDTDTDADTDTDTDTDTGHGCGAPSDAAAEMGALVERLEAHRCLGDADQAVFAAIVDRFFADTDTWCDAVWRVSSADGLLFSGTPERVVEHASVPDVWIAADGAHHLVYNDLTPGRFVERLRDDPEAFWRVGLVGLGGLGLSVDSGAGFSAAPVDLALPALALVVDPDLGLDRDGLVRLATFQVAADALDGVNWDPLLTPTPHRYFRSGGADESALTTVEVVASSSGERGGSDPTVLDAEDGEILYAGDFAAPLLGWSAPAGVWPALGTLPDVITELRAAAPDAVADPAGGWRLYFKDPTSSAVGLATSVDGRTWSIVGPAVSGLGEVQNPSVARAPDGTWWLYYAQRDAECMEAR